MLPLALTICLISFIESLAIAKMIEAKTQILPSDSLIRNSSRLGYHEDRRGLFPVLSNDGKLSLAQPSMTKPGARTGISSVVAAYYHLSSRWLFLMPMFYYLPKAILASIIVVAVTSLINYKEAVELWHKDRKDFRDTSSSPLCAT
jgi:SulP family sulfate permease